MVCNRYQSTLRKLSRIIGHLDYRTEFSESPELHTTEFFPKTTQLFVENENGIRKPLRVATTRSLESYSWSSGLTFTCKAKHVTPTFCLRRTSRWRKVYTNLELPPVRVLLLFYSPQAVKKRFHRPAIPHDCSFTLNVDGADRFWW